MQHLIRNNRYFGLKSYKSDLKSKIVKYASNQEEIVIPLLYGYFAVSVSALIHWWKPGTFTEWWYFLICILIAVISIFITIILKGMTFRLIDLIIRMFSRIQLNRRITELVRRKQNAPAFFNH